MTDIIKLEWAGGLPVILDDEINDWVGVPYGLIGDYFITSQITARHKRSKLLLIKGRL
jgi:hypothetical protein